MKKSSHNTTLFNKDRNIDQNIKTENKKTTNVNILLNRVRLDKKRDLKKKILYSLLLVLTLSCISILAII